MSTAKCDKCKTESPLANTMCYNCEQTINSRIVLDRDHRIIPFMKYGNVVINFSLVFVTLTVIAFFLGVNIYTGWIHPIAVGLFCVAAFPLLNLIIYGVYYVLSRRVL